jgi:hypothetical protein
VADDDTRDTFDRNDGVLIGFVQPEARRRFCGARRKVLPSVAQSLERAVSVDLANLAIERIAKVLPVFSVSVCHGRTIPLRGFHLKQPDVRRVFLVDRDGSVRLAEERSPDVTTRIGSNKRGEQTREPARQHAVAPELEGYAEPRPLLVIELDGPACPDRFEVLDDLLAPGDGAKPAKQCVPLFPGDLDDLSRDVDLYSVEPARFHLGRAYFSRLAHHRKRDIRLCALSATE